MNVQVERMENQIKTVVVEATSVESEIPVAEKVRVEEFNMSYDVLVTFVKDIIHQGNIRSLLLQTKQGRELIKLPLLPALMGLTVGSVLFPLAAVAAAIAFLVMNPTLVIERKE